MKPKLYVILSGLLVSLFIAFNNCSKVDFAPTPDRSDSSKSDVDIEDVIQKCASETLHQKVQTVVFEDTRVESGLAVICPFGQGDNYDTLNTKMRARYDQSQNLSLPANAVVCDIGLTTNVQSFRYDDVFFLTYNDRVLATNNKTALLNRIQPEAQLQVAGQTVPLMHYDWLKLRDGNFDTVVDDYCLGKDQGLATCTWPISESPGSIQFDFHNELLINLGLLASNGQHNFGFVITGDNDEAIDCFHERLEFQMNVKYYLK